jgi:hypothetical protein
VFIVLNVLLFIDRLIFSRIMSIEIPPHLPQCRLITKTYADAAKTTATTVKFKTYSPRPLDVHTRYYRRSAADESAVQKMDYNRAEISLSKGEKRKFDKDQKKAEGIKRRREFFKKPCPSMNQSHNDTKSAGARAGRNKSEPSRKRTQTPMPGAKINLDLYFPKVERRIEHKTDNQNDAVNSEIRSMLAGKTQSVDNLVIEDDAIRTKSRYPIKDFAVQL